MYFNDPSFQEHQQYQQYLQMQYYPTSLNPLKPTPRRNSEWMQVATINNVDLPRTVILDPYEELIWCGTENVSFKKVFYIVGKNYILFMSRI